MELEEVECDLVNLIHQLVSSLVGWLVIVINLFLPPLRQL